jgi:hypothetical protein
MDCLVYSNMSILIKLDIQVRTREYKIKHAKHVYSWQTCSKKLKKTKHIYRSIRYRNTI